MLVEQRQRFRRVPGAMADLDGQRVIAKTQQHRGKIRHRFLGAMEGKRELQQDRAELAGGAQHVKAGADGALVVRDRKSTRLNSSHTVISYAVFCLKKKR